MKSYSVNIDFKKPPSFSTLIDAKDEKDAKETAKRLAKQSGFDYPAKKTTAREVVQP